MTSCPAVAPSRALSSIRPRKSASVPMASSSDAVALGSPHSLAAANANTFASEILQSLTVLKFVLDSVLGPRLHLLLGQAAASKQFAGDTTLGPKEVRHGLEGISRAVETIGFRQNVEAREFGALRLIQMAKSDRWDIAHCICVSTPSMS